MNLFLIGYRCTGKTTVANIIAGRLHRSAVDADVVLEQTYGKTIREIFADEGELGFRDKETAVLRTLCDKEDQVISTGGGVILRPENRTLLQSAGKCVWLTADPDTIWQRMSTDVTTADRRPNLASGGLQEIENLLRQREPLYQQCADFRIPTDETEPESLADRIEQWWQSFSNPNVDS